MASWRISVTLGGHESDWPDEWHVDGRRRCRSSRDGRRRPDRRRASHQGLRREESLEPLAFETLRPLVSNGSTALISKSFPQAAGADFEALRQRFLDIYRGSLAVETRLYAGLHEVLERLESNSITWGIVTNEPGWLTTGPGRRDAGVRRDVWLYPNK
jgi:phosphoglycolate phosphatase-like HAD superfamily hydrolase